MAYPATFDVQPPMEFDKAQVVLRVLIVVVLSFLQVGNIIFGGAYLLLPVVAAILISQKGAEQYLVEAETGPTKWLRYILGFYSYMALATDKIPTREPEKVVELNVQPTGSPTVGSALLRIILGIPHAIVLGIVGIAFAVVWLIAAISILLNGTYPDWASSFIRGYLRWTARLLAYMSSLVDEYPPFSFQDGEAPTPRAEAPPAEPAASEPPPTEPPAEPPAGDAPSSESEG
jgi:hypothetical protein